MNTVLKGNIFEDKAYEIIMAALNEGQIGFIPGICRPFKQKKYFAHDRNDYVKFDMSIEVWPVGAERYSNICFIECKDYGKNTVPVGEIIKFVGDIKSVTGENVKGIFISSGKLQKAAKAYAQSHGLMVIYVNTDGLSNMILHNAKRKSDKQIDVNVREFSEELDLLTDINDYYNEEKEVLKEKTWDEAIYSFLNKLLNNTAQWRQPDSRVEGLHKLSQKVIEQITTNLINTFDSSILPTYRSLPMERFILYFTKKYKVKIITDMAIPLVSGKKINGYYDMGKKVIHIDQSLKDTPQFNFVLAHEIGHYFLHSSLRMDQLVYESQKDSEYDKVLGKYALVNEKQWIEWQANQFAAALLMPRKSLLAQTLIYQINNGINGHRGTIYVDYQQCNQQTFDLIKEDFTSFFKVSHATLEYRLSDLGILEFGPGAHYRRSNPGFEKNARTIGQVIGKMNFSTTSPPN